MIFSTFEKYEILKEAMPIEHDLLGDKIVKKLINEEVVDAINSDNSYNADLIVCLEYISLALSVIASIATIISSYKAIEPKSIKSIVIDDIKESIDKAKKDGIDFEFIIEEVIKSRTIQIKINKIHN